MDVIEMLGKFRDAFSIGTVPFVGIAALVGAIGLGLAAYAVDQIASRERVRLASDVLLFGERVYLYVRWVPAEHVAVHLRKGPDKASGHARPTFYIKNVGVQPVTNISVQWTLQSDTPIATFFKNAPALTGFNPTIDLRGIFTIYGGDGQGQQAGYGLPASDAATNEIAFLTATPATQDGTPIEVDPRIINGLVFRVIGDNQVPRDMGMADGPSIHVEIIYRDQTGDQKRRFEVSTINVRCQDNVAGGMCGDEVKREHYSDVNFRGMITLTARRVS